MTLHLMERLGWCSGKAKETGMRIGQLAERLDVNPKTIRFYESIGLIPEPERTPAGYRIYEEHDAERIEFIKIAQRLGLTLDDIREVMAFRERGERPCEYVVETVRKEVDDLERRIKEMRRLRRELLDLLRGAEQLSGDFDEKYCPLISHRRASS